MTFHIAALCRFPVKALSPQPLEHAVLQTGGGVLRDHGYALAHGAGSRAAGGGAAMTGRLPRTSLITLSDCPRLATLHTRFIDRLNVLTVERDGRQVARGDLTQPVGRAMLEDFFGAFLKDAARGGPRIVIARPGETFANHETPGVVLINRASVADIERVTGTPVDPPGSAPTCSSTARHPGRNWTGSAASFASSQPVRSPPTFPATHRR